MRYIFIVLNIWLFLALFSSCSREEEEIIAESTIEYPDQESWQATIRMTKDGRTVGLLKAGHIQKFSKKKLTLLQEGIKVDFYNKDGQHTSVLNALGGKVFDERQDMLAFGDVVVVSDSGVVLYTDTLHWDNENQKIFSDISVAIITDEADTLYGDSFKSDPGLANYEIENPRGRSSKMINLK